MSVRLVSPPAPRVLLVTEGTYPYVVGGVSSWCDLLVSRMDEFEWQILPIATARDRVVKFALPDHARIVSRIEVWSQDVPPARRGPAADRREGRAVAATLVRGLIGWEGDVDAVRDALTWCRRGPGAVRAVFRSRASWEGFLEALGDVMRETAPGAGPAPAMDQVEAATLYQTLYWVARTAAAPTPQCDVLLVTAAGWASVPAVVHRVLHGTPMVLTEHGVYVREAYLAAIRGGGSPGSRFTTTRLARGLARLAYANADVIAPVTEANVAWELRLGVDEALIEVVRNGLSSTADPVPPPRSSTVISVGRIDPLKDVHTMLRVAEETLRRNPDARFLHYGPVTPGEEAYGRSCEELHRRLGLGDRFQFMGRTANPTEVVRASDVVLMTSISEGLPMAILEAMGEGRPIVATGVGGVRDVVSGCGIVAAPGDVHGLAMGVTTLLRNADLAWSLGRRGHRRLTRLFDEAVCVEHYRELLRTAAESSTASAQPASAQLTLRRAGAPLVAVPVPATIGAA